MLLDFHFLRHFLYLSHHTALCHTILKLFSFPALEVCFFFAWNYRSFRHPHER
jgi:hypothetical protein